MFDCTDKVVLITGASSGIGEAAAHQFAKLGAQLILVARREEKLDALSDALKRAYNCNTLSLVLDVTDRPSVERALATLESPWKNIDVLVNNAGLAAGRDPFQHGSIDDWEQMIDTNVKGLLYVTRAIVPGMLERNLGHIINIGSIAGRETYPNGNIYCATKAAVRALSVALKKDLHESNIRVTEIEPGLVETEFSIVRFKGDTQTADKVYADVTPLTAEDVADTIVYCATRPAHVNIAEVLMFATCQSGATMVHRQPS